MTLTGRCTKSLNIVCEHIPSMSRDTCPVIKCLWNVNDSKYMVLTWSRFSFIISAKMTRTCNRRFPTRVVIPGLDVLDVFRNID